jgi:hypothetical protein
MAGARVRATSDRALNLVSIALAALGGLVFLGIVAFAGEQRLGQRLPPMPLPAVDLRCAHYPRACRSGEVEVFDAPRHERTGDASSGEERGEAPFADLSPG